MCMAMILVCGCFSGCSWLGEESSSSSVPAVSETTSPSSTVSAAPASPTPEPTPVPTPTPTATPSPTPEPLDYMASGGNLELPVSGATGYASVNLTVRETPGKEGNALKVIAPGTAFQILSEEGEWWQVKTEAVTGWVAHAYCFINLPDVIPSIVYNCSNASASLFVSRGKSIPNITGEKLYDAFGYNERLEEEEYIVPVLYAMAKKICAAQQAALDAGNTLVIYEGFRPYEVQLKVASNLEALAEQDAEVYEGITTSPWSIGWFIAQDVSNHQKGYAIDVSLASVEETELRVAGEYGYTRVTSYTEYEMPTAMHELSAAAASLSVPVSSQSRTAWQEVAAASSMNEAALLLRGYCTDAGLTPLASEWWHFNDLDAAEIANQTVNDGNYYLQTVCSAAPAG